MTRQVVVPALAFGATTFSDVPAELFVGAIGNQKMSVVGGAILKRFHIVIDQKREWIYLAPVAPIAKPAVPVEPPVAPRGR